MPIIFRCLIAVAMLASLSATAGDQPKKESEKLNEVIQQLNALKDQHRNMFGVRPSTAWPLSADELKKRSACSGPSHEELVQAMSDGRIASGETNKDILSDCSRDDNPYGDERAFNCFQIGKFYAKIEPISRQLKDQSLPSLSQKIVVVYKDTAMELGDILSKYFTSDLPSYCMDVHGRYASTDMRSFNEYIEERQAFGRAIEAAIDSARDLQQKFQTAEN